MEADQRENDIATVYESENVESTREKDELFDDVFVARGGPQRRYDFRAPLLEESGLGVVGHRGILIDVVRYRSVRAVD